MGNSGVLKKIHAYTKSPNPPPPPQKLNGWPLHWTVLEPDPNWTCCFVLYTWIGSKRFHVTISRPGPVRFGTVPVRSRVNIALELNKLERLQRLCMLVAKISYE